MITFLGTVSSDFMKKVEFTLADKLDLIDYAGSDFLSLRNNLIDYIKAAYPLDYQNFSESDLGVMLIEIVAYMGAVLSLKADLLANENFISSAQNRYNVRKLLELIGIRIKGPMAAAANARMTLKQTISDNYFTVRPAARTISITSPEDGGPLNYTVYKIISGKIEDLKNLTGNINLYQGEAIDPDSPSVWENIALIEGALVTQTGTFGTYGGGLPTVSLDKGPVIEGSVQVVVDAPDSPTASGTYELVESIYFSSGATDRIFQVNLDDSFGGVIIFGDGIAGVQPPPNSTYFITYRVGGGTRGNLQTSIINTVLTGYELNADGSAVGGNTENISMATGGTDAETVIHAKKYGPLFFKSQDRLVTLADYIAHTNKYISNYSTMGKATAAVRKAYSSANVIDIYVLEKASNLQLQKASSSFKMGLLTDLNKRKMLTDELAVVDGIIRTLDLIVTVKCDRELAPRESEILSKVQDNILGFFDVDKMDFGEGVSLGDLNRSIFTGVEEVRFSSVDNLTNDVEVDFNEIVQLNNLVTNIIFV